MSSLISMDRKSSGKIELGSVIEYLPVREKQDPEGDAKKKRVNSPKTRPPLELFDQDSGHKQYQSFSSLFHPGLMKASPRFVTKFPDVDPFISSLFSKIESLEMALAQESTQVRFYQSRYQETEARLADLVASSNMSLNDKMDKYESQVSALKEKFRESESKNRELKLKNDKLESEIRSLTSTSQSDSMQIKQQREMLRIKERETEDLFSKNLSQDRLIQNLKAELSHSQEIIRRLEQERHDIKKNFDTYEMQLNHSVSDFQIKSIREDSLKNQLTQSKDILSDLRQEIQLLRSEKNSVASKLDKLLSDTDVLRAENFNLRQQLLETRRLEAKADRHDSTKQIQEFSIQNRKESQLESRSSNYHKVLEDQLKQAHIEKNASTKPRDAAGIRFCSPQRETLRNQEVQQNLSLVESNLSANHTLKTRTQIKIVNPYKSSGNILTWGTDTINPQQTGSPKSKQEPNLRHILPLTDKQREQLEIEKQIANLDQQIIKVAFVHFQAKAEFTETKNLAQNGLTLRKKRQSEEKIEELEKERRALRSKLKMTIIK